MSGLTLNWRFLVLCWAQRLMLSQKAWFLNFPAKQTDFWLLGKLWMLTFHKTKPCSREIRAFSCKFSGSTFKMQVKTQKFKVVNPISFSTFLFLAFYWCHVPGPVLKPYPTKYYPTVISPLNILNCGSLYQMYLGDQVLVTILHYTPSFPLCPFYLFT